MDYSTFYHSVYSASHFYLCAGGALRAATGGKNGEDACLLPEKVSGCSDSVFDHSGGERYLHVDKIAL